MSVKRKRPLPSRNCSRQTSFLDKRPCDTLSALVNRTQVKPFFYFLPAERSLERLAVNALENRFYLIVTSETSRPCSDGSETSGRSRLQRQKAQSRKTFKFRKTRKEVKTIVSKTRTLSF